MKTFPTIYKLTNTGAITTWHAEVRKGQFRTHHGHKDGAITTSEWTDAKTTNAGRSNQRDPFQQAVFEVEAEYTKKLKRDYHETEEDARGNGSHIFEPMLAQSYNKVKQKHLPKFPDVYSQPKLDGMRCIVNAKGMFSRTGEPIVSCPHIFGALEDFFEDDPNRILDGELYNHDLKADFDELISVLKKTKPTSADLEKAECIAQYHIYDFPSCDEGFDYRHQTLIDEIGYDCYEEGMCNRPGIHLVDTDYHVKSQKELDQLYKQYLEQGYEGQMIRADAPYENKRTWSLMKRKEMLSEEFKLLSIHEGKGNWSGKARFATLKTKDGKKFKGDIVGTMEFCARVLRETEKYIGKDTTVVFQNYTPDGIPRFPKIKELGRLDHK